MNFGRILGGAGAFYEGVQQNEKYQESLQAAKQGNELQKLNLDQIKKQIARDPEVAKNLADFLSGLGKSQPIPPPPPAAPQAPAPGQASVPMQQGPIGPPPNANGQPPISYPPNAPPMQPGQGIPPPPMPPQGQPQQGPQGLDTGALNPQQIAFLARKDPQAFAAGIQHFQRTSQPQIPPYRSMNDAQRPPEQQPGIPPPPQQDVPRPNSMTLQDAAKFMDARGVTDPMVKLQVLDKLAPYLNNEAKQEAAALRAQVGLLREQSLAPLRQAQTAALPERTAAITKNADANQSKADSASINAATGQTNAQTNIKRVDIAEKNLGLKSGSGELTQDYKTNSEYKKQVDYWADLVSKGGSLPPRFAQSGAGKKMYGDIISVVPDRSGSAAKLIANQVGLVGDKAASRAVGTRSAAIELAANEARQMSPLVLETSAKFNRTNFPKINEAIAAFEKGTGDVAVVQFGAAINSFINAYARAINPGGVATVSDKEHAREILSRADTPEQVKGILELLDKEMSAAQAAPREIKDQQRRGIIGNTQTAKPASGPSVGTVQGGYRFKGGNPASPSSWEKI